MPLKAVKPFSRRRRKGLKRLTDLARDDTSGTGGRLRERRLDLGLRQAELAKTVGISPSYLNLIEHNRRRIGAALLDKLAVALEVESDLLSEGAEPALVDRLRQTASDFLDARAEIDKAEEFGARYPGWASLIAALSDRVRALETQAQLLADRITYDPELATALHGVISAVTSIRSTAAILTGDDKLDADWQGRFHRNIHDDAMRLAADSEALVAYLDAPGDEAGLPLSPAEEAERWLLARDGHLPALEEGGAEAIAPLLAGAGLSSHAARVLQGWLRQYAEDAADLPLAAFAAAAKEAGHDPYRLAARLNRGFAQVLRRLASLPSGPAVPPRGLAVADQGGFLHFVRPAPGFAMPRGTACPLWPVFTALGQPGRPVSQVVTIPGQRGATLACHAIATAAGRDPDGVSPPVLRAIMLVLPDPPRPERPPVQLGVSCRICPRRSCLARREPSVLTDRQPDSAAGTL